MEKHSNAAKVQCERTAREYYAFRKRGATSKDIVETPAMKRLIGDVRGRKVIDCGCGFGTYSIWCAQQGASVIGVDISTTMIGLAKQEAETAGVDVEFRALDVADMPGIPSEHYDLAISSVAICFDVRECMREIGRVLRPGGFLCFSEVHPFSLSETNDYFSTGTRSAKNVFGKTNPDDPDYEWKWEPYTLEDYWAAITDAGFLVEEFVEPKPEPGMRNLNPELYDGAVRKPSFFLIRALKPVAPDQT